MPVQAQISVNAVAGSDNDVPINTLVQLDNVSVEDFYLWEIVAQPPGTADALSASNIKNPTFTPKKEGTYLLKLTVNPASVTPVIDQVIVGVRDMKTNQRIPAPAETDEDDPDEGWAEPAANALLRFLLQTAADPAFIAGVNDFGGAIGARVVVRPDNVFTLKTGLDGEEDVIAFTKALATTQAGVTGALCVVDTDIQGNPSIADDELGRFRRFGLVKDCPTAGAPAVGDPVYVTDAAALDVTPGTVVKEVGHVVRFGGGTFDCVFHGGVQPAVDLGRHLMTTALGSPALGPVNVFAAVAPILFKTSDIAVTALGVRAMVGQTADLFQLQNNAGTKQTYVNAAHDFHAKRLWINQAGVDAGGASNFSMYGRTNWFGTKYSHVFESWNAADQIRLYTDNADTGLEQSTIFDIGRASGAAIHAQINLTGGDGGSAYGGRIYTSVSRSALVIDNDTGTLLNRLMLYTPYVIHGDSAGVANFAPDFRVRAYSTFYGQEANFRIRAAAGAGFASTATLDGAADGFTVNLDLDFTYVRIPGTELRLNTSGYLTGTGADGASIRAFAQSGGGTTHTFISNPSYSNGWRHYKTDNAGTYTNMDFHLGLTGSTLDVVNILKLHAGNGATAYQVQLYADKVNASFFIGNGGNVTKIVTDMDDLRLNRAATTFSSSNSQVTLRGNDGGASVQDWLVWGDHATSGALTFRRQTSAGTAQSSYLNVGHFGTSDNITSGMVFYGGTGAVSHGGIIVLNPGSARFEISTNDSDTTTLYLAAVSYVNIAQGMLKLDNNSFAQGIERTGGILYLGTTDAQDVSFKANATEMWRILSTGQLDAQGGNRAIRNVLDPTAAQHAATKNYVDTKVGPATIVFGNSATPAAAGAYFVDPCFGVRTSTANEIKVYFGSAGKVQNMYVSQRTGSATSGNTYLVKKGSGAGASADTTLTVVMAAAATLGSDLTHSFTVAAGDFISMKLTAVAGITGGATDVVVTVEFTLA